VLFGLDHLVHTAGEALLMESLAESDPARARRFLDTRLWGAYAAVKCGAGAIREGGSVVLTTGTADRRPMPGTSVAASLRGAMESPTRAPALKLAPLRINVVAPGLIRPSCGGSCRRSTGTDCSSPSPDRSRSGGSVSRRTSPRRTCI
jgi:NAD(P)-dependent dehydrogenase (short-subunit alcohol dehydrogenase family)